MRQPHLIISNAVIIWACRVLMLFPQVILVPYLIRTIGESGYGIYTLIWSLLMGIDRFERSLQSGVVKYSASFLAVKRMDEVNKVASSSFVFSFLLAVLASAFIFIIAIFNNTASNLGISLFIVAVLVLFIIPLTPYIAIIQSLQRFYVGVLIDTASKYISLGLIFTWFTLQNPSIEALIVIMTSVLLFSRVVQIPVAYRLVPGLKVNTGLFNRFTFRLIVAFGSMTVVVALCGVVNTTGIRWIMSWIVSTSFVTHLAIILMPGLLLSQIVLAMTITIMPATSAYETTGNRQKLRDLLVCSMRYTSVVVLAAFIVATLLIKDILILWVGPNYVFLKPYILALFGSMAFLMITSSAHHMLKGLGKLRITVFIQMLGMVVVPISVLLIVYYQLKNPYLAVTLGLILGNILSSILNILYSAAAVRAPIGDTLRRVFVQPFIAAIISAVPFYVLLTNVEIHSLAIKVGIVVLPILLFFILMYFAFATAYERQQSLEISKAVLNYVRRIILNLPAYKEPRL